MGFTLRRKDEAHAAISMGRWRAPRDSYRARQRYGGQSDERQPDRGEVYRQRRAGGQRQPYALARSALTTGAALAINFASIWLLAHRIVRRTAGVRDMNLVALATGHDRSVSLVLAQRVHGDGLHLAAKFIANAAPVVSADRAKRTAETVWSLEKLKEACVSWWRWSPETPAAYCDPANPIEVNSVRHLSRSDAR